MFKLKIYSLHNVAWKDLIREGKRIGGVRVWRGDVAV
jgi:hypothetical protein